MNCFERLAEYAKRKKGKEFSATTLERADEVITKFLMLGFDLDFIRTFPGVDDNILIIGRKENIDFEIDVEEGNCYDLMVEEFLTEKHSETLLEKYGLCYDDLWEIIEKIVEEDE